MKNNPHLKASTPALTDTKNLFLEDTLKHFSAEFSGGMNWYAFNEPDPKIKNDPVRGGEHWARFIETAVNYYLIKDEQKIVQKYAKDIGGHLPAGAVSVDLGPGSDCAILGKTLPFIQALKNPTGFKAVDVNHHYAQNAATLINQKTSIPSDYLVGDFLNQKLEISNTPPAIFSLFGGLLCNSPKDNTVTPLEQLGRSFDKLGQNMNYGDYLVITQDTNQNEESLMAAYTHPDMARYILSIMHRIKRDLPTENFDPDMFEFVPRWNKKESLLSLNARVKKEYGVPAFKIAGVPFTLRMQQEIPLVNSYKFGAQEFINAAKSAGMLRQKTYDEAGEKIVLHIFKYYQTGRLI